MSGRIRTVKPELLEDAVTAGLSDRAFRLFIAVILMADDYGRLRAEPRFIAGQVYWLRECSNADMAAALAELVPLVLFYDINGQRYAAIRNWDKHQKVSHPGRPRIPAPPETLPKPSGETPETLRPDLGSWITDPGPPTQDHRPAGVSAELAAPEPERSFDVGTASAVEATAQFSAAVSAATKKPFRLSRAPHHATNLCDALNAFAPPGPKAQVWPWLVTVVTAWVEATDPVFAGGWAPEKFLGWLNADRPGKRPVSFVRGRRPEEITKQPYDPEAPWMKAGES